MREDHFNDLDNYLTHMKVRRKQWSWFLNIGTFVVVGVLTFGVINMPAMQARVEYAFAKPGEVAATYKKHIAENRDKKVASASGIENGIDTNDGNAGDDLQGDDQQNSDNQNDSNGTSNPNQNDIQKYQSVSDLPEDVPSDGVYISKIDVKAPITWNSNAENVQELLSNGVVHIGGSAMPGTPGNVFITGHSSDVWWTDGDYKTVFSLLDKVENDDEIVVRYADNNFLYKVYNKEVIDKEDVDRFVETDKEQSLTIMTCFPIGTNWRRLMVQAERI